MRVAREGVHTGLQETPDAPLAWPLGARLRTHDGVAPELLTAPIGSVYGDTARLVRVESVHLSLCGLYGASLRRVCVFVRTQTLCDSIVGPAARDGMVL